MSNHTFKNIEAVKNQILSANPSSLEELEQFRIQYLGSKNSIKPLFSEIKDIPVELKKEYGIQLNSLKQLAEDKFSSTQLLLNASNQSALKTNLDLTAPGFPIPMGSRHPIALTLQKIIKIFEGIGFVVAEDREIEDDWHNFTAMNTPEDHPARDMQDTYYLKNHQNLLLRTHTSSVQARVMESNSPPIRIIAPGRVYRNETISARSHAQFHQVEGLYINESVSFADLKQTLLYFAKEMYGPETKIRLRPSYFPFTEPSAEMDVSCFICNASGCNICKHSGWVEVLGCGMVDPAVLDNCGIDSKKYTGFAFGMGIERQAMMLHNITDIRLFFENDIRFIHQFVSA
jgi:phenylalanyl-tRNA synthetase alpha chain